MPFAERDKVLPFAVELYDGDALVEGATVMCSIRRRSDGEYRVDSPPGWQVAYNEFALTELTGNDALKGRYEYELPVQTDEDTYEFRVLHTFPGDATDDLWSVVVTTTDQLEPITDDRLMKLDVSGDLAHADAAATYKADLTGVAAEATLTAGIASVIAATQAAKLTADGLDAVVVDGLNFREWASIVLSSLAGVLVGAETTEITISTPDGLAVRIVTTVDEDGNRSAVVLTPMAT